MRLPTFSPEVFFSPYASLRARALAALLLVTALLLAACGEQTTGALDPSAPSASLDAEQVDVEALIEVMLAPDGPDAVSDFLAELPPAATVTEQLVRNRHQPWQMDTLQTRDHGGVTLEVYVVSSTGQELLSSVRVSEAGPEFHGMTVGMPADAARAAAGGTAALHTQGASEVHQLSREGAPPAQVTLEFGNGELSAFTVHAFID